MCETPAGNRCLENTDLKKYDYIFDGQFYISIESVVIKFTEVLFSGCGVVFKCFVAGK